MTLIFLRGIDKMLMDIFTNKKFAENLIVVIGENIISSGTGKILKN